MTATEQRLVRPRKPVTKPVTLHKHILNIIEGRIVSGEWPPGHQLPYEVDLAKTHGVSRMTVNKVLTQLARSGLIERRRKLGSFVAQPQAQSAILEIHDIETEVKSLRLAYRFDVVRRTCRAATGREAKALGLSEGAELLAILCVHHAGDRPFCMEDRLINLAVVPAARAAEFSVAAPGAWLSQQVPWSNAEHRISAVAADAQTAKHLSVARHAPCLVVQRQTWSGQGPVTLVRLTYPAERHAVVARFTPATPP